MRPVTRPVTRPLTMCAAGLAASLAGCVDEGPPHGDDVGDCRGHGELHAICLTIDDEAWATLHDDPQASLEVAVAVVIDGEAHVGAELELHGGYARTVAKKSYRLKLAAGDRTAGALFDADDLDDDGHRRVVLQASWIDPTFVRNKLALDLIRAGGGLAPRVGFAEVFVNGARHGLYTLIERIDEDWLARQGFATAGNLYKAESNEADWRAKADPLAGYDHELGDHPTDDLVALIDAVNTAPATEAGFAAEVEPRLELADVLRYQLVHTFAQDQDAYSKNYLLYHDLAAPADSAAARFRLISWDADSVFGRRWDGVDIASDEPDWHGWDGLSARLFAIPSYLERYLADYAAALADELAPAALATRIDAAVALIGVAAAEDLAAWQPELDFAAAIDDLRASTVTRHQIMSAVIDELRMPPP